MSNPSPRKSIESVIDAIEVFGNWPKKYDDGFMVFRGQCDFAWKVSPTILRPGAQMQAFESEIIREIVSVHPEEFSSDKTMFDQLVRMQHFGLLTRLIDVTVNPLVALFFATEIFPIDSSNDGGVVVFVGPKSRKKYFDSDTVSCIANLANLSQEERNSIQKSTAKKILDFNRLNAVKRLLQFVKVEKPYFLPKMSKVDLTKPVYVIPKMSNKRLVAQSGSFLIEGLDRGSAEYEKDIKKQVVRVPAEKKSEMRDELDKLGINESTLFPDIERTARRLRNRFSVHQ